ALFLAAVSVVALPAGWTAVALAGVATVGLAADRRLGWLPAGLLVVIALPYGRGADVTPWLVAGYPVRPPDLVIVLALVGATVALVRDRARARERLAVSGAMAFVVAGGVLLLVGAAALVGGILGDFAMRDVLRDARWWAFYAAAPLAVLSGTSRASLARGLLLGATALAIVAVATAVGPVIEGGLKFSALTYDRGTLRMQFGNSIFLVPAVGYATWALLRQPVRWRVGWLALLFSAQVLTLTRTSLLVTTVVVLLVGAAYVHRGRRRRNWSMRSWRASAAVALALIVGFVGGIGVSRLGTPPTWTVAGSSSSSTPEDPFDRITFGDEQSDITVIIGSVASGGRFATYLNAMRVISDAPWLGNGFGQLVNVRFAYNESRAHTIGKQPGVDNAYLTVALKAGALGVAAIGALFLLPLVAAARRSRRWPRGWFVAGWLGILALTVTQSFAVGGYGPFGVALLAAFPFIGYARTRRSAAISQR
ncbi:MAG: O-antigen ligase family protein, partial [Chloroflexota bacterium]|nr:O-antigen ligase family protein [Chloroflexota bacterium]